MKYLRLTFPILLILCVLACKNEPKTASVNTAPPAVNEAMSMGEKAAYRCPMDCEKGKLYDQPGQCPVCKMDLAMATADQIRHAASETAAASETTALPAGDPNKNLEAEVNALHDDVMKELTEMERVGREVKLRFKTLQGETQRKAYLKAIADISTAGMDMMAWMRDYRSPASLPAAEAKSYLTEQKQKLIRNRADIQAALAEGRKALGTK